MLDQSINNDSLISLFNLKTVNPRSKKDIIWNEDIDYDMDVERMSKDEQFQILKDLLDNKDQYGVKKSKPDIIDYEDPIDGPGKLLKKLQRRELVNDPRDPAIASYLISSQNFNSKRYLEDIYQDSTLADLKKLLRILEVNIQAQTKELRQVIDDNFINMVNFKKSVDTTLIEFQQQENKARSDLDSSKVFNPQRHNKIKSEKFDITSVLSECVQNINTGSALSIRPILEKQRKEQKLLKLLSFINDNKFFFDLPKNMVTALHTHEHDKFIEYYKTFLKEKENRFSPFLNNLSDATPKGDDSNVNASIEVTVLKISFGEVEALVNKYKEQIYNEVMQLDSSYDRYSEKKDNSSSSKLIEFVERLQQLNFDNKKILNPMNDILNSQVTGLKSDIEYQSNKFLQKFKSIQNKLFDYINSLPDGRVDGSYVAYISDKSNSVEDYFRASSSIVANDFEKDRIVLETFDSSENLDMSYINEAWITLLNYFSFIETSFLKDLSKFSNNYILYWNQKEINVDSDSKISSAFFGLINDCAGTILEVFSTKLSPDKVEVHPKDFGSFVPYYSNSLSAIFYLSNVSKKLNFIFTELGNYASRVGNSIGYLETNKIIKMLRTEATTVNQKIVEAICATWINDCSQFYDLENWEVYKSSTKNFSTSYTRVINILENYERYVLMKLSNIVYLKDKFASSEEVRIVTLHPSKRLLVSLEIQFIRSLNVLTDSVMKKYNSEKQKESKNDDLIESELYKVLTMNNLDVLGRETIPSLTKKYDALFSNSLSSQNLKLYADIDKGGLTILDDILVKEKSRIESIVSEGFKHIKERKLLADSTPKVERFVFECLIHFVKLVHILGHATGKEILRNIFGEMQLYFLKITLECMRSLINNEKQIFSMQDLKLSIIFFVEVFEPSKSLKLSDNAMEIVEIILEQIHDHPSAVKFLPEKNFDQILIQCLKDSDNEFSCFM